MQRQRKAWQAGKAVQAVVGVCGMQVVVVCGGSGVGGCVCVCAGVQWGRNGVAAGMKVAGVQLQSPNLPKGVAVQVCAGGKWCKGKACKGVQRVGVVCVQWARAVHAVRPNAKL